MIESTVFLHSDDGGTDHEEVPVYLPLWCEFVDDDNGDDEDDD